MSNRLVVAIAIAIVAFTFQIVLQAWMRPYAFGGMYFQKYSSEAIMQSLPIEDLRDAPVESLFNIHIQPPLFDTIRAILANLWSTPDSQVLLQRVDKSLYMVWTVLYALLGALLFWWLSRVMRMGFAILATAFFLLHPACLFYTTMLDATFISALLILWMYYLLWKLHENPQSSIVPISVAVVILFFTRAIFQSPSLLVIAVSLFLLKVPLRRVLTFLLIAGLVMGLYLGKQYCKFGLLTTSSFTGLNLEKSIRPRPDEYSAYIRGSILRNAPPVPPGRWPSVLVRDYKLRDYRMHRTLNFNHLNYLWEDGQLMDEYKTRLATVSWGELCAVYMGSLGTYFQPSVKYETNVIADRVFWQRPYNHLFSTPYLPSLLIMAVAIWAWRAGKRKDVWLAGLGLALPGLFIIAVSVLCEIGENMRYKFFIEPVFFVLIVSQLYIAGERIRNRPANSSDQGPRVPETKDGPGCR